MDTLIKERLLYMDYLRLMVIMFVVMLHLSVTYSAIGSWYYYEPVPLDAFSLIFFALFQSFTQGYTMGFMFLLAGYFTPGAYDKKGFSIFMKNRLYRLGVPTLIYVLIIHPSNYVILVDYYAMGSASGSGNGNGSGSVNLLTEYANYITSLEFISSTGPLWFALALLIFSIIYGLVRRMLPEPATMGKSSKLSNSGVVALIAIITAAAFLIRLVQPIGTSVLNMQLCFFAQYIILFIIGIKAYRNQWLDQIDYEWGRTWFRAALIIGISVWIAIIYFGGALTKGMAPYVGGFNWTSFAYAAWESFVAVSMAVGLLAIFKEKYNKQNRFAEALSDSAFTVYVFHALIIIAITYSMRDIHIAPLLKFLIACTICLPVCFGLSHFVIRRIPFMKKVL